MLRKYALVLALLSICAGAASAQAAAQEPPASLVAAANSTAKLLNAHDARSLSELTVGDPKTIFRWDFRPGMPAGMMMPSMAGGAWKAGVIRPPDGGAWLAVFWQVHPCESEGDHVHRVTHDGSHWKIGPELPEADPLGYRFKDHAISVAFDLPAHRARFSDDAKVVRLRGGRGAMQFRLTPDFPVDGLSIGGRSVAFTQVGSVVYLKPPDAESFTLHVTYQGMAPERDMFVGNLVSSKEVVLAAYWYPVIGRLPTTHTDTVTAPRDWTVVCQGNLLTHSETAATGTWTYRMDVPNCYFTLDAGPYHRYEKTVNGRTYGCYTLVANDERAIRQTGLMDPSFRLFERIWGPYPYNHYTIVETQQNGWPGALESYTFTTYGKGLIPSPNPHEWGHTWWGGFVPNTYLQDIWNESFAVYSESVYARYGDDAPASTAVRNRLLWSRAFPGMDKLTAAMPLSETADALYGPSSIAGYGKGGIVMQNLEETLGADTLWRCMHAFRDQFDGSERAATWSDFERVVDRVTGKSYAWWFDQWVRRPGLPTLHWENVKSSPKGSGYEVQADLVQEAPAYRLAVPVWLEAAGADPVKTTVDIAALRTRVRLECNGAPQRLVLDPEMRLPRAIAPAEVGGGDVNPGSLLVVAGDDAKKLEGQFGQFGVHVKAGADVTDADLKNSNVLLLGGPTTNRVWARFADRAPFGVEADGIRFHDRAYSGAQATGMTDNPLNAKRTFIWFSPRHGEISLFALRDLGGGVQVTDADGRLIDGDAPISKGGPGVYVFK